MTHTVPPQDLLSPMDEHNGRLLRHVHPPDWRNPVPHGRYNLVVIGAGTAGLVTAAIAASLGAKVALIERHLMGGDCLNVGCVPSKGIIAAARAWTEVKRAARFGITPGASPRGDFGAVMERMRRLRADLGHVDSAARFQALGVDVYLGHGRFAGRDVIDVDGVELRFATAVIATGARAAVLPVPGLAAAGALTNETVFSLTALPRRLAVIGAGPIGCEMGQAFARCGSTVSLFERADRIMSHEDDEAAALVAQSLQRDGVALINDAAIERVTTHDREKVIHYLHHGQPAQLVVDEILLGIGRAPNVDDLGLERAGVDYDAAVGVKVDHHLRTANPRIFAAGDVCSALKFTHAADAMAQIVVRNALFPHPFGLGYARVDRLIVPRCIYTSPEIAQVGLTARQAHAAGIPIDTFTVAMSDVDRAVLEDEAEGFARVCLKKGTDRIVGATVCGAHAGDLISALTLAMNSGLGLAALGGMIYPYPTRAEVIRKVANAWRRTMLTDGRKRLLRRLFAWRR